MCNTVICYAKAKRSCRGKVIVPKNFPRFTARAIMVVLWGPMEQLVSVLCSMAKLQHTYWAFKNGVLGFSTFQGEYSKEIKPHLQGVIIAKRGRKISSVALYKLFRPENADALQLEQCRSVHDAIHYCQKPHNNCDCDHCEKARGCKLNWSQSVNTGVAPKGQGVREDWNKFHEDVQAAPTQKTLIEGHPHLFMRYHTAMEKMCDYYQEKKMLEDIRPPDFDLANWERDIDIQLYVWDPKVRHCIIWIWSKTLGTGKSEGMKHIKYFYGNHLCMDGMRSGKHLITAYKGETLIHFNYPWKQPPTDEDLQTLEMCADGGIRQGAMYKSPKRNINAHVFVTANIAAPLEWTQGANPRVRLQICLDKVQNYPVFSGKAGGVGEYVVPMEQE